MGILISYRAPDHRRYASSIAERLRSVSTSTSINFYPKSDDAWLETLRRESSRYSTFVTLVADQEEAIRLSGHQLFTPLRFRNHIFVLLNNRRFGRMPGPPKLLHPGIVSADFRAGNFWRRMLGSIRRPDSHHLLFSPSARVISLHRPYSRVSLQGQQGRRIARGGVAGLSTYELLIGERIDTSEPRRRIADLKNAIVESARRAEAETARREGAKPAPPQYTTDGTVIYLSDERSELPGASNFLIGPDGVSIGANSASGAVSEPPSALVDSTCAELGQDEKTNDRGSHTDADDRGIFYTEHSFDYTQLSIAAGRAKELFGLGKRRPLNEVERAIEYALRESTHMERLRRVEQSADALAKQSSAPGLPRRRALLLNSLSNWFGFTRRR